MGTLVTLFSSHPNGSIVVKDTRDEVPADVQLSMDNWHLAGCWADVPADYTEFHLALAQQELKRIMSRYTLRVKKEEVIADGWLDGMRVLQVDVITRSGRKRRLVWCDSNQGFMVKMGSGGQACIFERDLT